MRRLQPRPSALFFRLFVAALAFAFGLAAWGVWRRRDAPVATPTATSCGAPNLAEVTIGDTPAKDDGDGSAVFDQGSYENDTYGYSVRIPGGMVGLGATPPAPQHGFGIDLDNPRSTRWPYGAEFPKSYVYVDGSYNSLEWARNDDAADFGLRCLREKGRNVRVRSRLKARLGGLDAVRVVTLYEQDGEEMLDDEIVSIDAETGVVFTLGLSTPRSKYERDRPVLEALRRSWCLQPVE